MLINIIQEKIRQTTLKKKESSQVTEKWKEKSEKNFLGSVFSDKSKTNEEKTSMNMNEQQKNYLVTFKNLFQITRKINYLVVLKAVSKLNIFFFFVL